VTVCFHDFQIRFDSSLTVQISTRYFTSRWSLARPPLKQIAACVSS